MINRTIVIHQSGPNYFVVSDGNRRTHEGLTWDETIGQVAAMVTAGMGQDFEGFSMKTDAERLEEIEARAKRDAEARYSRPFERLLTNKVDILR